MSHCGVDHTILDLDLVIARRRADACSPGSPSWDAAMGMVEELEDELRQVDPVSEHLAERLTLAQASN
jgi:hypothetical protein